MVVFTEVISNWVTLSVVANRRLMVVDSKLELFTCFPYIIGTLYLFPIYNWNFVLVSPI